MVIVTNFFYAYRSDVLALLGSLLSFTAVFISLTYLLVPFRITLTSSIIIFTLVFALTKFYVRSSIHDPDHCGEPEIGSKNKIITDGLLQSSSLSSPTSWHLPHIFLAAFYVFSLIIVAFSEDNSRSLFIPWEQFSPFQGIQIVSAIALSFFLPGYFIQLILDTKNKLFQSLPRVLLAYLISLLITGSIAYGTALAGVAISDIKIYFVLIYLIIFVIFIIRYRVTFRKIFESGSDFRPAILKLTRSFLKTLFRNKWNYLVFSSLVALIFLYMFFIYGGTIIGDQWYHHGRSLLFINGTFRDSAISGPDRYPPFFSAPLSAFFVLSGSPSVNAYALLHFFNILPVLAFYYFFTMWVPSRWKNAALFASVLFMLGSGFGWIHALDIYRNNSPVSPVSSFEMLNSASVISSDIGTPASFILAGAPNISTPLQLISLTTGFLLLGLIKQESNGTSRTKLTMSIIFMTASTLALLSHDEFYIFIIIASILPIVFNLREKTYIFVGFLFALAVVITIDILSPVKYYSTREMFGLPIIILCLIFEGIMWIIYSSKSLEKLANVLGRRKKIGFKASNFSRHFPQLSSISRFYLGIIIASIFAYLYLFTFIVEGEIPKKDISIHTNSSTVPWYLYPIKFGLPGLLALTLILSYIFKKFEKEVFCFAILAIIAFLLTPYYYDHRFGKYIMAGLVALAALVFYEIITYLNLNNKNLKRQLLGVIFISVVTASSILSTFMFLGYSALDLDNPEGPQLHRRDFPSLSEVQLLNYLRNHITNFTDESVAITGDHRQGFNGKIDGFVSPALATRDKFLRNQPAMNASSIEAFYDLIDYGNISYFILPKSYVSTNGYEKSSYPVHFALENFKKVYQDENYTVLSVPPVLKGPSSKADVGIIHPKNELSMPSSYSPLLSGSTSLSVIRDASFLLPYRIWSFEDLEKYSQSIKINAESSDNETNTKSNFSSIVLHGDMKRTGITIFSNQLQSLRDQSNALINVRNTEAKEKEGETQYTKDDDKIINYIQGKLRIIGENRSRNDAGIKWTDGINEYYASLKRDKLDLEEKPLSSNNDDDNKQYFENREIKREKGIWYTLEAVITNNSVSLYVDGVLAIEAPRGSGFKSESKISNNNTPRHVSYDYANTYNVSKVGIKASGNIVEFEPIIVGHVFNDLSGEELFRQEVYLHYYPISSFALSNITYDTFQEGDYSAFTKKYLFLSFDPYSHYIEPRHLEKYLQFARSGGSLILINPGVQEDRSENPKSNNAFENTFAKSFFNIQTMNSKKV
jgi:hypothetical protein